MHGGCAICITLDALLYGIFCKKSKQFIGLESVFKYFFSYKPI